VLKFLLGDHHDKLVNKFISENSSFLKHITAVIAVKLGKQAKLSLAKYGAQTIVVEKEAIDFLESAFGTDSATDFPPMDQGIGYCEHIEVRYALLTMKGTIFLNLHTKYLLFYLALYF